MRGYLPRYLDVGRGDGRLESLVEHPFNVLDRICERRPVCGVLQSNKRGKDVDKAIRISVDEAVPITAPANYKTAVVTLPPLGVDVAPPRQPVLDVLGVVLDNDMVVPS